MRYVLVVLLIVAAAAGGYYVANQSNRSTSATPTVTVSRGSVDVTVDITGTVSAKESRGLAFGTPGNVASVKFAEGDSVKQNDVIAALDTRAIDSQLKAAQSALTSAQSALKVAREARDKLPSPSPSASAAPTLPGQPTETQLDANIASAQAAIASAQAAIDAATLAQTGAVIKAPFTGVLTHVLIHVGDYVSPGPIAGTTFPVEVADTSTLEVVAGASEDDVVNLTRGQEVRITFDALSDVKLAGTVCEIPTAPTPIQGVPTYPIRVCLSQTDPNVRLGLTATAGVVTAHRDNVLLVPAAAIRVSGDDHIVNVVTSDNTIVATTVQVGQTDGTHTEIRSGLKEGDRIQARQ